MLNKLHVIVPKYALQNYVPYECDTMHTIDLGVNVNDSQGDNL